MAPHDLKYNTQLPMCVCFKPIPHEMIL
ncbi:hypothetical protein M3J09_013552 [Ascochyta lentis]